MKKIICFRNSKLGDYLISIPALKLIKKNNPNSKIYYLTSKNKFAPILPKEIEKNIFIDEFIYYQHDFSGIIKLLHKLKSIKFDKIYYLQENSSFLRNFRDFLFFSLIKLNNKIGFFFKTKNYKKFNESLQILQRVDPNSNYLKLLKLNKLNNYSPSLPLFKGNYITLSIGGFSQPEKWHLKNWSILLDLLLSNYSFKILILGTKEDYKSSIFLQSKNRKQIFSFCGKTNLNDLFNLIKFSKLHVTNDNGSMQAACLLDKKMVCLFNNHDPYGKWFPFNKNSLIVRPKDGVNEITPYKVLIKINDIL